MFNTLKEILLDEIKQEVEEAKAILDEISEIEKKLSFLLEPKKYYEYKYGRIGGTKYTFNEKHFSKKYKEKYKEGKLKYVKDLRAYLDEKKYLEERLQQLRSTKDNEKLRAIIKKYEKIRDAKNIKELGYTFEQVIRLFKEKGIPIIIDETDTIIPNESKFDKLEDLVLIHKTNYAPKGDIILTTGNAGATRKQQIVVGNTTLDIEFPLPRQTVHFAVNGEVASHNKGDWNDSKYAIIIPLVEVPNISTFSTADTFTNGNVDVSKGYLLCPVSEMEEIQRNNPNLIVIGYKGNINSAGKECVTGIADKFITQLGYKHKEIVAPFAGGSSWAHGTDEENANELVKRTIGCIINDHSNSKEGIEESGAIAISQFLAVINGLLESDIEIEPERMASQLTSQLLIAGRLDTVFPEPILTYDQGRFLGYVRASLWHFATDLWEEGIKVPSYLEIFKNTKVSGDTAIEHLFEESRNFNNKISDDSKALIEKIRDRDGKNFELSKCLPELLFYEVLKEVKRYKQEKSMKDDSVKTM